MAVHHTKQYYYKKFTIPFLLIAIFSSLMFSRVFAQENASEPGQQNESRIDELKSNISNHTEEIKKLEEEIKEFKTRLEIVGGQKKTLQNEIATIDLTRSKISSDIKLTQLKITRSKNEIGDLTKNISTKEQLIQQNRAVIAEIILKIDQSEQQTFIETLLANTSLANFFQDIDDMERLQVAIRDQIKSLEQLKNDLGSQKNSQEKEQRDLTKLNNDLADQKLLADQKRVEQNRLLSETKNQESNFKKLLNEKEARKKQFEKEIDDFEAQLRAEIDLNSFPRAGTKALAYPLDDIVVTQKFGRTADSVRLYAAGTHNGIDFRASPGTRVKASLDGLVVDTGDTDSVCRGASYGKWVLIKHRNGLTTLYSHLELIKVNKGQNVEMGDTIGYSGSTGYATGPHLHMGLFVSSAVEVMNLPSKSCKGAIFRIPVSPPTGYLDPQAYF